MFGVIAGSALGGGVGVGGVIGFCECNQRKRSRTFPVHHRLNEPSPSRKCSTIFSLHSSMKWVAIFTISSNSRLSRSGRRVWPLKSASGSEKRRTSAACVTRDHDR